MILKRLPYLLAFGLSIALGLFSRSGIVDFPPFIDEYLGDIIWGGMVYFLFGVLLADKSAQVKTITALTFSFAIEFSQLIQTTWMNEIRRLPLMPLILGFGFKWSDLVCYCVGILLALFIDRKVLHGKK